MYMKNVMYKILVGCYIVAALVLVTACNDGLDIQQAYPFTVETLPVPKKLKVGETAEIRCQLVRSGYYQPTTYQIRYFQPDGKGRLEMDDGTVFLPNDLYPLEKETFRLYYTSASTDHGRWHGVPPQRPVPAGERDLPALLYIGIDRPADD